MLTVADVSLYKVRRLPVIDTRMTGFTECQGCGQCCKTYPGLYVPDDFGCDMARMEKAILDGVAQADKWDSEGDALGEVWFLRAPHHATKGEAYDFMYGGRCALLRDDGCSLQYEGRPRQCRGLVPVFAWKECVESSPEGKILKRDHVATWKPFSDQVEALAYRIAQEVGQ